MSRVKLLTILLAVAAPLGVIGQTRNCMGGTPAAVAPPKSRAPAPPSPQGPRPRAPRGVGGPGVGG